MDLSSITEFLAPYWSSLVNFGRSLLLPSRLWQVAGLFALFGLAHLIAMFLEPRITARLRSLKDVPMWRMRIFLLLRDRMRMMLFFLFCTIAAQIIQEVTWASRAFLISAVGNLAGAWLAIVFLSRIIKSPPLRKLVRWGGWIWVTLYLTGLLPDMVALLDSAAIEAGKLRISLLTIIKAIIILAITLWLARLSSRTLSERLEKNEDISPAMRVLTGKLLTALFYALAIIFGLQAIGFDLTSLTVLSGAIGLGLGFGLQKIVSNLVSGVILLMDKSLKPGDVITLGDDYGWVNQLGARYVSVLTRDGREHLIPNEELITSRVVNWSYSSNYVRLDLPFQVAYQADPHLVQQLAREAPKAVQRVAKERAPVCNLIGFGESGVDFNLRFWITDPTGGLQNVRSEVYMNLWDILMENEIEIPYPRREVTLRRDKPDPTEP
ncbi:mechanosensitive ion channel family protein [Paracoccaceae bacterium GXU_MW_L88]